LGIPSQRIVVEDHFFFSDERCNRGVSFCFSIGGADYGIYPSISKSAWIECNYYVLRVGRPLLQGFAIRPNRRHRKYNALQALLTSKNLKRIMVTSWHKEKGRRKPAPLFAAVFAYLQFTHRRSFGDNYIQNLLLTSNRSQDIILKRWETQTYQTIALLCRVT
jgi:hypothetical protein